MERVSTGDGRLGPELNAAELEARLQRVLGQADLIGTELSWKERRDEYTMEAGEVARRVRRGDPLDSTVVEVFQETCGIKIGNRSVRQIVDAFMSGDEIVAD